jgi:hypothetical protein
MSMRERTVAMRLPDRCLRPRCPRPARSRGLCDSDYHVAYSLVMAGVTTWEQLENEGKALELKRVAKEWFLEIATK